jgi:isoquinoline 1-oxidoreductase beta subunit
LKLDRRTLLVGGGIGVGLIVFATWPRGLSSDLDVRKGEQAFGNYIKIRRDGRVTVAVPQVETGQGIWTALPQIVADELGASWDSVGVEPAPLTGRYANSAAQAEGWPEGLRITAGSTSIRAFEQVMREAAAVARMMLVGAAADRWNIDASECEAADGLVIAKGQTFTFGELAEEAATRTPPRRPAFRPSSPKRLIGQALPRLDGPAKANGSLRFASDVRLPGMLFASARLAPPGGRLTGFDRSAAERISGVRHLAARDGSFAIAADTWWAAEQAVKAANPRFSALESPADVRPLFEEALASRDGAEFFSAGDYEDTVRGSRALAATYYVAPSLNLGLEPVSATARFNRGELELWLPTLAPEAAKKRAEKIAGVPVNLYPMPVGNQGGRGLDADAIPLVIQLARAVDAPVQLALSQSASQNHDRPSGGLLARMMALPTASGAVAAWKMRVAGSNGFGSALAALTGDAAPTEPGKADLEGAVPPYSIPNVSVEAVPTQLPYEAGYMRGSPQREMCFANESFIDELARAIGQQPLALRMAMLGSQPRLARCLQAAARAAQWDGGGPGSTMGIAGCSAFGSHIGLVAVASIDQGQRIKVHKLVAAVDCGRIVNSGLVTQQIEGGLLWALAQATVDAPEWIAGMPKARSIGGIALPKISDTPDFVIQLVQSNDPPGGVSGLGTTVLAPAVANAVYAGTGKRLRSLPFDLLAA